MKTVILLGGRGTSVELRFSGKTIPNETGLRFLYDVTFKENGEILEETSYSFSKDGKAILDNLLDGNSFDFAVKNLDDLDKALDVLEIY